MSTTLSAIAPAGERILHEVGQAVVGKASVLRSILSAVLADGHILLEDNPGLAKTLIAKSFATALGLEFRRIQFTPDLLPGDITGSYVHNRNTGQFELRKGPIFTNILLADEINRASPKTQSALLEAMQEGQVTLEGESMPLPKPFIVIATQNPIEYEGTFPLPEAQLDRFLVKLSVGYPSLEEEQAILSRRRERRSDAIMSQVVSNQDELLALREAIEDVYIADDLERYIVQLVDATRRDRRVAVGASPRGSLALLKLARVHAALEGRDYVLPDDIKRYVHSALIHRITLTPDFWMQRRAAEDMLNDVLRSVVVPVSQGGR